MTGGYLSSEIGTSILKTTWYDTLIDIFER